MDDPKVTLLNLLKNWNEGNVGFIPKFNADWYDRKEEMPQVVVSRVIEVPRRLGLSDNPTTAQRRVNSTYAIDVWSKGDNAKRWKMIQEVDRIILAKCNAVGGDLDFAEVSSWRDLDEVDVTPKIYRSQILVGLLYFKSGSS